MIINPGKIFKNGCKIVCLGFNPLLTKDTGKVIARDVDVREESDDEPVADFTKHKTTRLFNEAQRSCLNAFYDSGMRGTGEQFEDIHQNCAKQLGYGKWPTSSKCSPIAEASNASESKNTQLHII